MKRKIIDWIAGRKALQGFFETLYTGAVYGMNYGNGGDFRKSGEKSVLKYIKSKLAIYKERITLFDVGANRGNYTIELSNSFSDRSFDIHSFEPSKATFDVLLKNVGANERVTVNNFGFGDKPETVKLFQMGPVSGLSSVYERRLEHSGIDMSQYEQVQIRTIDDYCKEKKIERIHFLKLDIEGHEYKCLLGSSSLLRDKKIDFIQFEFGGCNIDSRTFFQDYWYLLKDDFNLYRIVKNGLVRIAKYNERWEIFKNINYLAALKKYS